MVDTASATDRAQTVRLPSEATTAVLIKRLVRFYDKKRSQRLIHTHTLLAHARRLIDVLWALLRDGRLFSPTAPTPITSAA